MGGLKKAREKVSGLGDLSSIQEGARRENAHRGGTKVPEFWK